MASNRTEILWSPTLEDTFLTWSSNLQLYQTVDPEETIGAPQISLGEKYSAKLVTTNNDYQYIKCVSWYYGADSDFNKHLVAVGLANGRIAITNFNKQSNVHKVVGKEYVARNSRQVNSLAWNPTYHQFLVGGMDRAGKDYSLVVIDISQGGGAPNTSYSYDKQTTSGSENLRSYLELSSGEHVHSVEFSRHDPQIILAGVNNRLIKLYDMRSKKSIASISTKATCTIVSDPFYTNRFASSHENVVHIWDVRYLERSVLNLTDNSNKTISKLSWCPTRYGFLASLPRDCSSFRLYDIQCTEASHKDDHEPRFVTRSISTEPNNAVISSFSWHPTHENRLTMASYSGLLHDHVVMERVMMDFSNRNSIVWSSGKGHLSLLEDEILGELEEDISSVMKKRAINKYGLKTDNLIDNGTIGDNPALLNLWTWLEEGRRLSKNASFKMPEGGPYKFQGVWNIISSSSKKSEIQIRQWSGVEGVAKSNHVKIFKSEERSVALTLCSWKFDGDSTLTNFTDQLESLGQYTRAAAIAVFNLNIPMAIKILQSGAERENKPALNTTAMALAGYTIDRKALWRETCISLLKSISDPYVRSTFAFLTGESETFDVILRESSMTIQDRVAFACKYLSDVPLLDYLNSLKSELIKNGNLSGMILTGLEQDGLDLIQRYIDMTGDVQTAAFVVVHALNIEPNSRASHWIEQYRNLLNNLQLWKERALLDVLKNTINGNKVQKKTPQIFVSCNFCLKSISVHVQAPGRTKNPYALYGKTSTQKSKMTSCPNCRKPLPRCCLCLQHMGTPSKRGTSKALSVEDETIDLNKDGEETEKKILTNFSHWFTWCQACHHGGHAHHMMDWFKEFNECPVGACTCKCMEVDGFDRLGVSIAKSS